MFGVKNERRLVMIRKRKKAATEDDQPSHANGVAGANLTRSDFFNDLKKVVKKLPPDHPSRSGVFSSSPGYFLSWAR